MAADKRAARLGVLALVATLLFGAVGARLWFLQTVQAESLQQTVDARKTKTVPPGARAGSHLRRRRPHPRRQRAGPHGQRRLGRDPPRHRPRRAVHPPVRLAGDAGRRDGGALRLRALQPLPADAAEGGRRGVRGHRPRRAGRGLPRRLHRRGLAAGLPVRPAGQPRPRLHGRDHRRGPGPLRRPRLRHVARRRGGRPQRRRAEHGGDAPRPVGRGRLRGRRQQPHRPRDQLRGRRSTGWTSSCRSTSTCSSTPSGCCRPSCACSVSSPSPTRRSSRSRPTAPAARADGPQPRRRHPGRATRRRPAR